MNLQRVTHSTGGSRTFIGGAGRASKARVSRRRIGAEGSGVWKGDVLLPNGEWSIGQPPPRKFLDFLPWNGAFCVHSDT